MIQFNKQNNFKLHDEEKVVDWLISVAAKENKTIGDLSYVFCSDEFLLDININFLQHDTYTDIVTFDYCEEDIINGEIYISTDRVRENAEVFDVLFKKELARVTVHGLLHLCGYPDKTDDEKKLMRSLEDKYILEGAHGFLPE